MTCPSCHGYPDRGHCYTCNNRGTVSGSIRDDPDYEPDLDTEEDSPDQEELSQ